MIFRRIDKVFCVTVRVVDAPLESPASHQGLLSVFQRRYLLKLLVQREISARYQGTFLGLMWSYINPLTQLFVYWFVFGKVMGEENRVEKFPIHIFAGFVITHFFIETFASGTRSIVRNKSLVQKMAVPREMFPVSAMLVSLYHTGPQIVILAIIALANGWTPDLGGMAAMVLGLALIMVLGTALALVFSVANVYFRDFSSVVGILTNFVRFGVPMMFSYQLIEQRFHSAVFLVNWEPVAIGVMLMQRAFWVGTTHNPEGTILHGLPTHLLDRGAVCLAAAFVILIFAQLFFSRFERRIPDTLR